MAGELPPIDPSLRIGAVHLAVSDIARSADFYEHVLGLPPISRQPDMALLGGDPARPALVLVGLVNPTPVPVRSTGLFHIAWLHPSRAALAATIRRVAAARCPITGASDHGVSEALYLSDPDALGIEIYADRPRELWQSGPDGEDVKMVTLPLDLDDLLASSDGEAAPAREAGMAVGHVHLKVADVARASAFYRDALGFDEKARLPGAAFLAADGYHHHVGLNSWQSAGASPPPDTAPGLRSVEFELADGSSLAALQRRMSVFAPAPPSVQSEPEGISLSDPDGDRLVFRSR
jgi:catechol 2,3-dioxygenase